MSTNKTGFYATCIGYFMTILDVTVVNVALGDMQHQLGASVHSVQWVVIAYTLTFAAFLLSAGILGELFGNRRIYLLGLIVFVAASLLCGLAPGLLFLQIARAIQGIGASLMVPTSLALIVELFPQENERSRAMGVWGAVASIGAGAGPVIGGLLVNGIGWRSIFLINIPIGIAGLLLTQHYVQVGTQRRKSQLDIAGQMTAIISLGAFTLGCLQAGEWRWLSAATLTAFGVGLAALLLFIRIEKRASVPMLPLTLFHNKAFAAGNLIGFLLNFGFYGQLFIISLYFQHVRHLSPLLTGVALLPEMAIMILSSTLSGRLSSYKGPKFPMLLGLGIGAAGFILQVLTGTHTAYILLACILLITGFGMAMTMPAMTISVMSNAPAGKGGTASGTLNAFRQAGSSFGVAIIGGMAAGKVFLSGLHTGMLCAAGAFFCSMLLTALFTPANQEAAALHPAGD